MLTNDGNEGREGQRTFGAGCVGRFTLTHGNDAISGIPQLTTVVGSNSPNSRQLSYHASFSAEHNGVN